MKKTRFALFQSIIALILCFSMLIGTTFAWFTDGVSSGNNLIAAGNLDVELYHSNAAVKDESVDSDTLLFKDLKGKQILWEPGAVSYENLRVVNAGDLALAYQLAINTQNENYIVDPSGATYGLSQILKVGVVEGGITATERDAVVASVGISNWITLDEFVRNGSLMPKGNSESEETWGVVIYWEPGNNDNLWNLNNGKTLNEGTALKIDLGVSLIATQEQYESDSFGNDYDAVAKLVEFPEFVAPGSTTTPVVPNEQNQISAPLTMTSGQVSAYIPAGVQLADGTTELTMSVSEMNETGSGVTLEVNEAIRSLDVHIEGVGKNNTVPMTIALTEIAPVGLNMGNYKLYHVEENGTAQMELIGIDEDFTAHNQFKYDPATGDITLYMATFSEVALVADTVNEWNATVAEGFAGGSGDEGNPYLIANADQFAYLGEVISNDNNNYGAKHYRLINNINFGGEKKANVGTVLYPIGYHKVGGTVVTADLDNAPEFIYTPEHQGEEGEDGGYSARSSASAIDDEETTSWYTYGGAFKGTFDGAGHTIANIYQNTWIMRGNYDGHYYKEAMGLFGYVYGGTIKNLTVENFESDGEFTPTGVIAAYAAGNATFENIAITNCNPRVYNTGNGGIIGIAGSTTAANDDHITLKNITVDNSNKISALWGSWDVACGGLVGMYRGNVDGSGNATGDTIKFDNCHVAAQIDVYNDVCANYQYYAYRYAGMMIGSVRHNTTNADGKTIPNMTGISASDCTVNYGTWNDYYYCEFVKNTIASYTHDYQFSRVDKSEITFDENGKITGCVHDHKSAGNEVIDGQEVLIEDKTAVYLPFHQLFTGYSWGVSSIGLKEYSGIVTDLGITEGDQEESVVKFETKFTGDFLYRVGNQNTVSVGSLFAAKDGANINNSGVVVSIDKLDENSNVSGTFTANTSDWTKGTIQFSGTGVVKVTIQDYNFCTPTVLMLEVVDAVNATSATNATSNNAVLLNNCGFSSLEVSGGYTLYGNGFTMTCDSDSPALDMGYAFVTLNNGTLDNVQIVTPNFDHAVLYKSNMTDGNRSQTTDKTRYYNVKSGVMASGNSKILNSRISGARAAVNVTGGNCVIDNSRIELGAVASLLVGSANGLTLRNVTLVQKPTASTYDPSKTLMGFSVLFICDADGNTAPVTLEGTLVQNAWVNENYKQYVPSAGQSIISTVLGKTEYLHDIDGDGKNESLNLGFAYMPESLTSKVNTTTITDNRTNKDAVPYDYAEVSILNGKTYVYSYKNSKGTHESTKEDTEYKPNAQSDIITVTYSDTADGLEHSKSFGTSGWFYELNVDLDKASGYKLDFSKLSMNVNGTAVTDFKVNGSAKPTSPVAVTSGGKTYTLTATVNGKEYTAIFKVTGTETSKESPSKISGPTTAGFGVAKSYGGDWSGAADVLTGVKVKYWSVAENKYVEFDFSNFTVPGNAGKLNGTNSYWEYTHTNNDFTLKVTNTVAIHSGKSVYGMPIRGTDGKLYFTISSTNGYVGSGTTSRAVTMQYEFTDNNGGEKLTFTHTFNISYNKDDQYSYSDLSGSGKLTKLTGSSAGSDNCVTPDTLITLANGKQVRVDSLTGDEKLLVWNLETGKYDTAPIVFVDTDEEMEYEIIHLYFSDGSDVKVISEHGFFDLDLGKYVYIDAANYADYVGHRFVAQGTRILNKWNVVTLDEVVLEKEVTTAWSPVTFEHLCYYTNGVLSMPGGIEGLFNIFEVDTENMRYDAELMQKDIDTFGLFTLEDFGGMISEEAFEAFNGSYLKVAMGKGLLTWEDIAYMAERYIPLM